MTVFKTILDLAGRILLGAGFLYWGGRKLLETLAVEFGLGTPPPRGGWEGYMEGHGVPYGLIWPAILLELACGLMLVLGWRTPYAALALAGFCVVVDVFFHTDFSNHANVVIFIKNLGLAGALAFVAAHGAGPWSLDARGLGAVA
jgi:putative oxidoreductase